MTVFVLIRTNIVCVENIFSICPGTNRDPAQEKTRAEADPAKRRLGELVAFAQKIERDRAHKASESSENTSTVPEASLRDLFAAGHKKPKSWPTEKLLLEACFLLARAEDDEVAKKEIKGLAQLVMSDPEKASSLLADAYSRACRLAIADPSLIRGAPKAWDTATNWIESNNSSKNDAVEDLKTAIAGASDEELEEVIKKVYEYKCNPKDKQEKISKVADHIKAHKEKDAIFKYVEVVVEKYRVTPEELQEFRRQVGNERELKGYKTALENAANGDASGESEALRTAKDDRAYYKILLERVYKKHDSEKLSQVDDELDKYAVAPDIGPKLRSLYDGICLRYGVEREDKNPPWYAHRQILEQRIKDIYLKKAPDKLPSLPRLSNKWNGQEEFFYDGICKKYGIEPEPLPPRDTKKGNFTPMDNVQKVYHDLIEEIYLKHNKAKIPGIRKLIEKYYEKEQELYVGICEKYKVDVNPQFEHKPLPAKFRYQPGFEPNTKNVNGKTAPYVAEVYRYLIEELYKKYNPEKLSDLYPSGDKNPGLFAKYTGKEDQMYKGIVDKYKTGKDGKDGAKMMLGTIFLFFAFNFCL